MTFDEWFTRKYGKSFDEIYFTHGGMIGDYMRALSLHMREYVSDMVKS